ncbi:MULTISPECIES: PP2C family protein-serine/threonine phosphatase [Streptomyces]|uniref:PP2C family protein-serine/threonine phosphatase n=1 Tax=Streptomyces lonegramiae TaxID=3075524 RepID=A0ABU2X949_9ACTN|nr:PP2C family protein-serine/threonine phosphatase [Streptomyces sp. DSM 41529]MDT0542451.1 PP2C family protein-serine/threonine phosphatase [Streptomyces sp. DSM 41529]
MNRRRTTSHESTEEALRSLGRLTAQILERIKLQQARVELAAALQRHMLPTELPTPPGLRAAARYTPARDGLDVGGDWYDVFALPGTASIGFAIGDVQGHDVEAAAFMGQVRTGLRAIAAATCDPGEVLHGVNELLISMGTDLFTTCTFLRFDPASGELACSRAGHVPAVRASAGRPAEVVWDPGGLPLGIQPGETYPVTRHLLTRAGAFVLFTDGVVEGPSYPIDRGLAEVSRLVGAGYDDDAEELAARVSKVADRTGHCDDAAVLVLRHDDVRP